MCEGLKSRSQLKKLHFGKRRVYCCTRRVQDGAVLPLRVGDKPNPPRELVSWGVSGELLGHSTLLETAAGSQGPGGGSGERKPAGPLLGVRPPALCPSTSLSAQAPPEVLESTGRSRFNTMRHSLFTLAVHPVRGGQRGDPAILGEGQEAMPTPPHTHARLQC